MRATFLYPQGDPQGEEENSQECGRAEKKGLRSWWRTGKQQCVQDGGQERSCWEGKMKSKYKKVLFFLFAFGGNIRYISLLRLPTNFYFFFFNFCFFALWDK